MKTVQYMHIHCSLYSLLTAPPKPPSHVVPTEVCRSSSTVQIRFRKNYFSDQNGAVSKCKPLWKIHYDTINLYLINILKWVHHIIKKSWILRRSNWIHLFSL